ncbi:MAG: DUF2619 domain-containing protein [Bacillota bacterium]
MHRETALLAMVLMRMLSGTLEMLAAGVMYRLGDLRNAMALNALLGLVGPAVLFLTTIAGVTGLAQDIRPGRLILVIAGVVLVFLGTRR